VYPASFEYYRATSVADAIGRLAANPDAKILAGGHSLIPAMKLRLATPGELVDLGGVSDLKGISFGDGVRIGAMATYNEIRDHAEVAAAYPILSQAINRIGDQQVRSYGTLGGSLAHNDPAADLTAAFLALGGEVTVQGSGGTRTIAADDLLVDLWTTSLELDEIITEIRLPALPAGTLQAYEKHAHPASGYAVVGIAVVVGVEGGVTSSARIAVTGATSTATRAAEAEAALVGNPANADTFKAASSLAANGLDINGDHYASTEYRAHLVSVLTRKALEKAAAQ
jgi:carbon-monoxide dehydrogenase medium subunit